jgi:hypothetical protein
MDRIGSLLDKSGASLLYPATRSSTPCTVCSTRSLENMERTWSSARVACGSERPDEFFGRRRQRCGVERSETFDLATIVMSTGNRTATTLRSSSRGTGFRPRNNYFAGEGQSGERGSRQQWGSVRPRDIHSTLVATFDFHCTAALVGPSTPLTRVPRSLQCRRITFRRRAPNMRAYARLNREGFS